MGDWINPDSILMDSDSDTETETEKLKDKGKGKLIEETETEKPKDKGKGKLIEDTQEEGQGFSYSQSSGQSSLPENSVQSSSFSGTYPGENKNYVDVSSLTDDEHRRLVRLQSLRKEMELLEMLGDHSSEILRMEKEEYEKTGFIDAENSHHAMAPKTSKGHLDEMIALQQKINSLEINNDNDNSKSVTKRSVASIYEKEEDLGGPSNKNTKYDSDSSSESKS